VFVEQLQHAAHGAVGLADRRGEHAVGLKASQLVDPCKPMTAFGCIVDAHRLAGVGDLARDAGLGRQPDLFELGQVGDP
jgi:hypothetical protein